MSNTHTDGLVVQDRMIDIRGGDIFTRTWTPGTARTDLAPVLLFHDSLGSVTLWQDFPGRLAQATARKVVAYDRLGFGQSSARQDLPDLDFIAQEARDIIPPLCERLGLERIVVCGHSVGGGMAVETAAHEPVRCQALVTIAAQAFVEERTIAGMEEARHSFADPASLSRLAKYHGEKARWVVDAWIETWLAPGFSAWSLDEALGRVICPTLAIHGERDEYGSPAHPQRIAAGDLGELRILPGIGHLPHRECPDTLVDLIASFLSQDRARQ